MWALHACTCHLRMFSARVGRSVLLVQNCWSRLKPAQLLACGFASYVVLGVLLLTLPVARHRPVAFIDNLFNIVSAISTTGLTTVSVPDSYTFLGELVLLVMFQLGGIGYMTITSFIILARGRPLSEARLGILSAQFALPEGFRIARFVRHVFLFSLAIESLGAALLYTEFRAAGISSPLWSSIFHSVSAFATAGFSLNNNSLEDFHASAVVNLTIAVLCYLGAIGFIVLQDVYMAVRHRHPITFTSKVILIITALILLGEMPLFLVCEPTLQALPFRERVYAAFFQVMSASTTSGFNTIPIGRLSAASLTLIVIAMVIGASPSGTGGGIKTTSLSVLLAVAGSTLRGRSRVTFFRHQIPLHRLFTAIASTMLYVSILVSGVFLLTLTEKQDYLKLVFETASALGTVGLSMGITSDLSTLGKWILVVIMFMGRLGPLTLGFALFRSACPEADPDHVRADLAT